MKTTDELLAQAHRQLQTGEHDPALTDAVLRLERLRCGDTNPWAEYEISNTFAGWLAALDHAEDEVQSLLEPVAVPA